MTFILIVTVSPSSNIRSGFFARFVNMGGIVSLGVIAMVIPTHFSELGIVKVPNPVVPARVLL